MYEVKMHFLIKITGEEPTSKALQDQIEDAMMSIETVRDVVMFSFQKDMEIYDNKTT